MLQKMRDQTQSLVFRVLVGIIVLVLAVFGFGAFNLFVGGEPDVATVNGESITQSQLANETERERRRLAARMGENFDPSLIDPVRLQGAVLEQLIGRLLMAQASEDLGVDVSADRVNAMLVKVPAFQSDGRYQPELYRQAVRAMGYTPQGFLRDTAEQMKIQQLRSAVSDSAFLTHRELNLHARLLGQQRDLAYLPFDTDRYRDQVEVSDEDAHLRYEENKPDYMTEESVDVAYVVLTLDALTSDPSIAVTEDEVRAAYDAEREAAPRDEERKSRHILLATGDERSAQEAVAALEEIKRRVEAGESFAEIAREVSEDPGSASQGGELGYAGRGVYDPAFEEALFGLEKPGQISEPVETAFGYHLIQLEDVRTNEYPSFEEARDDVDRRLRRERAEPLYSDRLRELDNLAFEHADSLDPVGEALGLEVQTVKGVTREGGPPPFNDSQVRRRLFSEDVLDKGFNSAAVKLSDSRAMVMRVTERHEPEPIPFEDVAADIRSDIETERARTLADEAFEEARASLEGGESATVVADAYGANWQKFQGVRRNAGDIPQAILQEAFSLPRPEEGGKSIGEAELPGGGKALITVTRVQDGQPDALTDSELEGMRGFLADRASRLELASFFDTIRRDASIERAE